MNQTLTFTLSSDIAFKYIFKRKENLKIFLEDILEEKIEKIRYMDTTLERDNKNSKECRLDIRTYFNDKNYANVEMEKWEKTDIFDRAL